MSRSSTKARPGRRFTGDRTVLVSVALIFVAWSACHARPVSVADSPSRPFPFHTTLASGVIKPTNVSQAAMDARIADYYRTWKATYLRNDGGEYWVKYSKRTDSTVSEAHGYGMVLTAYMADKAIFDSMFRYFLLHPSRHADHLMAWKQRLQNGQMVDVNGVDSATDGDLDIAYGLLLADVQWGSDGTIDYKGEAIKVLHDILAHEVNAATLTLTPGDWAKGADANHTRPSDFMSAHFLAFAAADPANASQWNGIYDGVARIVNYQFAHGSEDTGLMPDFMVRSGANFLPVPGKYLETQHDGDFSYNACRTPWRLSMSYILLGRSDMLPALRKQVGWIRSITAGKTARIRAGYYVRNGTNGESFVNYTDLAFTAPMAVEAMIGGTEAQQWLNRLWASITGGDFGPRNDYFGDTIRMQVMLTVAGDWWQP